MKYLILFLLIPFLFGAAPSRTYTYTSGNTIDPSEVTTNEDNIFQYLQAGVEVYKDGKLVDVLLTSAKNKRDAYNKLKNSLQSHDRYTVTAVGDFN